MIDAPLSRQKHARPEKDARHRKPPKEKSCCMCKAQFRPVKTGQKVCGTHCAYLFALAKKAAGERKVKQAERKDYRARRAAMKTTRELIKETQVAFNEFIRERDRAAGYTCISSGRPLDWSGNNVDAGHYRSVGSAPHLRFRESNCHAQSKKDNRYGAGMAVDYRIGLIARVGLAEVEAIEVDNTARHYTREDLIALRKHYKAKTKALRAGREEKPAYTYGELDTSEIEP
jgi:hypothetical protein